MFSGIAKTTHTYMYEALCTFSLSIFVSPLDLNGFHVKDARQAPFFAQPSFTHGFISLSAQWPGQAMTKEGQQGPAQRKVPLPGCPRPEWGHPVHGAR